jgi:hypothetical protein
LYKKKSTITIPITTRGITVPIAILSLAERPPKGEDVGGLLVGEGVDEDKGNGDNNNELGRAWRPRVGRGEF